MRIRKYINGIREIAPYLGRSLKETVKETAIGLTLAGALMTGIGVAGDFLSSLPERQYNVWRVERAGDSVVAINQKDLLWRIKLTDMDGDGVADSKYVGGFPRPGCYKISKPTDSDQELFERLTSE